MLLKCLCHLNERGVEMSTTIAVAFGMDEIKY